MSCQYCSDTGRVFSITVFPAGGSLDYDPTTKTIRCMCIRNRKQQAKPLAQADCPRCQGTKRMMVEGFAGSPTFWAFDPATSTCWCDNCGHQKPFGVATGKTYLRKDGAACIHEYWSDRGQKKCQHCPDSYLEA